MNISNKDKIAVKKLLNVADRINNCTKCMVKPIAKEHMCEECYTEHCQWCGEDDCLKPAYTVDGIAQYYCTSCHRWLNDGSSMV